MRGAGGSMAFGAVPLQGAATLAEWFDQHPAVETAARILALLVVCLITAWVVRKVRVSLLRPMIQKSRSTWDDVFLDASFFRWLSYLLVALVAYAGVGPVVRIEAGDQAYDIVRRTAQALMMVFGAFSMGSLLNAVNTIYSRRAVSKSRPIKGYIQIAKILLYLAAAIVAVALLLKQDPTGFLVGLGGMTAVLLLIFKDTILGLVASVQLTNQDMVRVGDWIEMPSAGADGDVIDVALHTVTVQNWDKTISAIPTYRMITDTFKNWRGMQASGGRRIKRSINIDMSTIRFLSRDDLRRFAGFRLLEDYIAHKQKELEEANEGEADGDPDITGARRLTNIGTFRAYTVSYLRSHPMVHLGMTFLVRQLQPTENGLPLEIYIFTRTTNWNEYEGIQADIFDHLLAILPEFGLRVFQRPAGSDLAGITGPPRSESGESGDQKTKPASRKTAGKARKSG